MLIIDRLMKEFAQSAMKSLPAGRGAESKKENIKELTIAFTEAQAKRSGLPAWQSAWRCWNFWRLDCSHPTNDDPVVVPRDGYFHQPSASKA